MFRSNVNVLWAKSSPPLFYEINKPSYRNSIKQKPGMRSQHSRVRKLKGVIISLLEFLPCTLLPLGQHFHAQPYERGCNYNARLNALSINQRKEKSLWQLRTLPGGCPPSTIGAGGLNFRVRDGAGCPPAASITNKPAHLLTQVCRLFSCIYLYLLLVFSILFWSLVHSSQSGSHLVNPGRHPCAVPARGRAARFLSWYSRPINL